MAEIKTKATEASVDLYLAAIKDETRRADCAVLIAMMSEITGEPPVMWGPSIVGFGRYHYRYPSGHEGDMCVAGFSSRKPDLSVYLLAEGEQHAKLLARLGKHKMGKSCLSIRRLADIDLVVLRELVAHSVAAVRRQYPD